MNSELETIYLDYAATTPILKEVYLAMEPYFTSIYGNPASVHSVGQQALQAVDDVRFLIADSLLCSPQEIYFTSGATESNNMIFGGLDLQNKHIIVSAYEHSSIIEIARYLELQGVSVTYIEANSDGFIDWSCIESYVQADTVLISVMYVNNETGMKNDISGISQGLKDFCAQEKEEGSDRTILFHSDVTQAIKYYDCSVEALGVDFLSVSAHKYGGPKGVGFLYKKEGVELNSLMKGGQQEMKLRPGTLNVPGIVGMGEALKIALQNRKSSYEHVVKIRDYFLKKLSEVIGDDSFDINSQIDNSSPHVLNIAFDDVWAEELFLHLDMHGVAVSMGSACSSASTALSHVLRSLNYDDDRIRRSIRFSFSHTTSHSEIDTVIDYISSFKN